MTKDLALLISPDAPWQTTDEFMAAIDENLATGARRLNLALPVRLVFVVWIVTVPQRSWSQGHHGGGPSWPAWCWCLAHSLPSLPGVAGPR